MNVLEVIRDFLNNYGAWQPRGFCSKKAQDHNCKCVQKARKGQELQAKVILFAPAAITQGVKLSSWLFMQKYSDKVMGWCLKEWM